jgi:AcrR family transcriptional regulator
VVVAGTATRTRLPREQRIEQTLDVARGLFAERGFAAVTMDEVAEEVGVTKPLLYNYFGNKEGLYRACMEPAGDALLASVIEAIRDTATPGDALAAGIRAFFGFVDQDRSAWRVLFDETVPASSEVASRVGDYRERLTRMIAGAVLDQLPAERREAGRIRVEALSTALLASAEALARWWLRTEAMTAEAAAELLIAAVEPGIRNRRSA